jgi:hypothetical protein
MMAMGAPGFPASRARLVVFSIPAIYPLLPGYPPSQFMVTSFMTIRRDCERCFLQMRDTGQGSTHMPLLRVIRELCNRVTIR